MNIIVTGASRGIGYQLSKLFYQQPNNKVFAIARTKFKLEQLQNECMTIENGSELIPIVADLQDDTAIDNVINTIRSHTDKLTILINCAGLLYNKPFDFLEKRDLVAMLNVNVVAPFMLIQKCMPLLRRSPWAHVINISSMGGFQGSAKFPGLCGYSASKAAIANLTECLAEEFKESSIRFNCLALGAVKTEMLSEAFPNYSVDMTAEKMAEMIFNFATNGYNYFNGKILPVTSTTP